MHDQIWAGNHSLGSFLPAIFQMLLPPALATRRSSAVRGQWCRRVQSLVLPPQAAGVAGEGGLAALSPEGSPLPGVQSPTKCF